MTSFIKAIRSEQAAFLDYHPNANHLLNVIARRARRTKCDLNQLEIGECFVSFRSVGMSEQQYRTAKKQLQKWNLVEFKKGRKVTDKGTVALLLDSSIYDINADDTNGRPTEDQRKTNGRVTTNKNDNNVKNGNKGNIYSEDFESFWLCYPKKTKKPAAQRSFNAALKKMEDSSGFVEFAIQDCLARFKDREKKFIPDATTYLNNFMWEDEICN